MTYSGHPDQHFGPVSYAQHGEDLFLCSLFRMLELPAPSYLDLGAHHPTAISNTRLLYERGSYGVNIEANPYLIDAFKLERPRDTTLCLGVAAVAGEMTLYMYSDTSGRNTMSPAEVKSMEGQLRVHKEITVKTKTLDQIVFENCDGAFPDLLNCDIEGLDFSVIESSQIISKIASSPAVICIETRSGDRDKMKRLLADKGFRYYCRIMENLIFVRSTLWGML